MTPPISKAFLHRRSDTHKGDYGHILVVGGSIGLTGAPVLCAQAALRAGAGLVTLAVPESIYFIVASKLTEVMVHPLSEGSSGVLTGGALEQLRPLVKKVNCVAVGPGLSQQPAAQHFVRKFLAIVHLPVVLDADGITAFAGRQRRQLAKVKGSLVLTPHPGEMARLLGISTEAVQENRLKVARELARETRGVIVLKGHKTVVAAPIGKSYINQTGNPGMATAGMGDLLTGIIAAFIGQGLDPFAAAKAGVYLHGLAGDIAARRVGQASLIASDVLAALPDAFRKVIR